MKILIRKSLISLYRKIWKNHFWIILLISLMFFMLYASLNHNSSTLINLKSEKDRSSDEFLSKNIDKRDRNIKKSGSFIFHNRHLENLKFAFPNLLNKSRALSNSFLKRLNSVKSQIGQIFNSNRNNQLPYLINTESCHLRDWPLFDSEILPLFQNYSNKTSFGCDKYLPLLEIRRVNFTWIQINFPRRSKVTDVGWVCFARELKRTSKNDRFEYGEWIGPLGRLNNFAHNLTETQLGNETNSRWDSMKVTCNQYPDTSKVEYSLVVPLVQKYKPTTQTHNSTTTTNPQVNVLLLGLDSISRLNFLRHMNKTKRFLESHNFIPLEGYHKVGENSFPNIVPMLTGHLPEKFYNQSMGSNFTFDHVPLIWKEFQKMGYITTFVEDMPPYGFFSERGGFKKQPTDYYLRQTNLALWGELYYTYSCYQKWLEHEIYWDFLLDQFEAFKVRENLSHFTFAHLSTLTHNYFNHPGYADRYYLKFIEKIFKRNYNQNSLIILYSDHGLRFGTAVNTTASIQEQRLPFIYIYVPENLVLNGKNASELREMLKLNRNRLTSHIDLHATMMHVLYGKISESEPYGLSLFNEIPSNRTCHQAGIKLEYCLCNSYNPIPVDSQVQNTSMVVLEHMNQLMSSYGNYCVPLTLNTTYRAFDSVNVQLNEHYRIVHFKSDPNSAIIEAMVRMDGNAVKNVENVSRLSRYGSQSSCVEKKKYYDILPFCYCWDVYVRDRKNVKK